MINPRFFKEGNFQNSILLSTDKVDNGDGKITVVEIWQDTYSVKRVIDIPALQAQVDALAQIIQDAPKDAVLASENINSEE